MKYSLDTPSNSNGSLLLPEPTIETPLIQLDFLFNRFFESKDKNKGAIKNALSFYKKTYLAATSNYNSKLAEHKLFYIHEQWDDFALLKVQDFIKINSSEGNPRRVSSSGTAIIISTLRLVMNYAALHKIANITHLYSDASPRVERETNRNSAYSDEEVNIIKRWLQEKLIDVYSFMQKTGYTITNFGSDPRVKPSIIEIKGGNISNFGWENIDNLRWYFENIMNCQAANKIIGRNRPHYWFYYHASKYKGGYLKLIRDWQIKPIVTMDIIMPLALKLSMETGLNSTSLFELTEDCFQEKHLLSGVPYLQYYKARSQGHMEMHLNIYDKNVIVRELKENQAIAIREMISFIKEITQSLRDKASPELASRLFLTYVFEHTLEDSKSTRSASEWKIRSIDDKIAGHWCRQQVETDDLKNEKGEKIQLALSRFRSTKITEMVRQGMDFFEIQSYCGHRSIITTLNYINTNNLETAAQRDVRQAIETIHTNQIWQKELQPQYAGSKLNNNLYPIVYKGISADCRDVFNPPDDIKKAKDYQPNQACTRYNMCLFCNNVVLMRHHLPALIVYHRQIKQTLGFNNNELPNQQHYHKTLSVLELILHYEYSEFSKDDLDWAYASAECLDEFIDPVVYRPNL